MRMFTRADLDQFKIAYLERVHQEITFMERFLPVFTTICIALLTVSVAGTYAIHTDRIVSLPVDQSYIILIATLVGIGHNLTLNRIAKLHGLYNYVRNMSDADIMSFQDPAERKHKDAEPMSHSLTNAMLFFMIFVAWCIEIMSRFIR